MVEMLLRVKREDPECKCHAIDLERMRLQYGYEMMVEDCPHRSVVMVIPAQVVECQTCKGYGDLGAGIDCSDCLGTGLRLAPKGN